MDRCFCQWESKRLLKCCCIQRRLVAYRTKLFLRDVAADEALQAQLPTEEEVLKVKLALLEKRSRTSPPLALEGSLPNEMVMTEQNRR